MFPFLAESAGLEPANMGVKDPRLRPTWRTLNIRCLYWNMSIIPLNLYELANMLGVGGLSSHGQRPWVFPAELYIKVLKEELETFTRRCPHNPFFNENEAYWASNRNSLRGTSHTMALRNGVEPLAF